MAAIFGKDRDKTELRFLEADIFNPLTFINDQCFKARYKCSRGPVHGDLHANNVIIDRYRNVRLIDFAWAHSSKHVLVDYVLMECSLRFLLFPNSINPSEQLEVDKILLEADGPERLAKIDFESPNGICYRRLGAILAEIRSQAREHISIDCGCGFCEYLAAQFLVLFGQMSFSDYNRLIAARALGLIARKLKDSNFGSFALADRPVQFKDGNHLASA